jgi:hypothetical protein
MSIPTLQQVQCSLAGGVSRTLYLTLFQDGNWYNAATQAMEAFASGHFVTADYCPQMAELGGSGTTGIYYLAFPASLPAGKYTAIAYIQLSASPSFSDTKAATGSLEWDGANLLQMGVVLPANIAPATNGGLPTVNASNQVTLPANAPSTFLLNDTTVAAIVTNQVYLLALTGHNQGIRTQTYDSSTPPNLLTCDLYSYSTAANAVTNDGATGVLHHYHLANSYTSGVLTSQTLSLIS